jgi:hypothetical protein
MSGSQVLEKDCKVCGSTLNYKLSSLIHIDMALHNAHVFYIFM